MKTLLVSSAVLALAIMAGCSKSKSNENNNHSVTGLDSSFAVMATQGNLAEIQAGQVSLTNSQDTSVQMFGQMMINDHNTAQGSLDSIGNNLGLSLPSQPDSAHIAMKQKLMMLTGVAFDTTYVNAQIMDHQKTLALLQNEINTGTDAQLKAYASKNYPIVQMHLMMADSLAAKLH